MGKLTYAQRNALEWCWPSSRRRWGGVIMDDPPISAFQALVRKGLVKKDGSDGTPIYFELTALGRSLLSSEPKSP